MSIHRAETVGIFVANTWLAKHFIFSPVSICQQWKQPWAQPCGISTENKSIIPSAFGKGYLPLSSCSQVQPNCQTFHRMEETHPFTEPGSKNHQLLLPKMLQRPSAFYPQAMDNLLTAVSIHEICPHCFTVAPTLHLKIITGGPNTKTDCPFAILSLLAGKWKMLSFVWICVSASQEMKLWSLPDGEWLWLFISLG